MVKKWFLVGVMLLLTSLLVVGCGVPQEDYDAVVAERDAAQGELASLQSELAAVQSELTALQSELAAAESDLAAAESEMDSLKQEVDPLRLTVPSLREEVDSLNEEVILLEDSLEPYRDSYGEMFSGVQPPYTISPFEFVSLINNEEASNPTWAELKDFLNIDRTDNNPYIEGQYMDASFAEDLHNNAEEAGIRAAWVSIEFEEFTLPYALNAFKTTDRGLVFINCTGQEASQAGPYHCDRTVVVKLGKIYRAKLIFEEGWGVVHSSLGIVKSIKIYW